MRDHITGNYPPIDFSKKTLLLAYGPTRQGFDRADVQFRMVSAQNHELNVDIYLLDALIVDDWVVAILIDKLPSSSKVELDARLPLAGHTRAGIQNQPFYYFDGKQWGLENIGQFGGVVGVDINAPQAWQLSTGEGVVVAVIDRGIQMDHPDLIGNLSSLSYDSESRQVGQQIYGDHGTKVAGIIGARRNNGRGIAGVAPDCTLMSISNSLGGDPISRESRAYGIWWAINNEADIINCSWGFTPSSSLIRDAI